MMAAKSALLESSRPFRCQQTGAFRNDWRNSANLTMPFDNTGV